MSPVRRRWAMVGALAAVVVGVGGVKAAEGPTTDGPRRIALTIHNSRFDRARVTVRRGELVEFIVHNTDPIVHELIVGPAEVQLRHEQGREPRHGARRGEVTIGPHSTGTTRYRVTTTKPVTFACHLPGHFAYGMHGVVQVLPAR